MTRLRSRTVVAAVLPDNVRRALLVGVLLLAVAIGGLIFLYLRLDDAVSRVDHVAATNRGLVQRTAALALSAKRQGAVNADALCKLKFVQLLVNREVRRARSDPENADYNPMVVAALDRSTRVLLAIRSSRTCVPPPNGSAQAFARAARELVTASVGAVSTTPTPPSIPSDGTEPSFGGGTGSAPSVPTVSGTGGGTASAGGTPPPAPQPPPPLGPVTTPSIQIGPIMVPPMGVCVPHLTC